MYQFFRTPGPARGGTPRRALRPWPDGNPHVIFLAVPFGVVPTLFSAMALIIAAMALTIPAPAKDSKGTGSTAHEADAPKNSIQIRLP